MRIFYKVSGLLLMLFFVASCGTTGTVKKQKLSKAEDNYVTLAKQMLDTPVNPEITADTKIKVGMGSYDATLKMRWNESIQISVTMLGIMEIIRIECLPDMIVFIDRSSQKYAVEHYADVPYRNFTGLDFYSLQALLWNKIFVPGYADPEMAIQKIKISEQTETGLTLTSTEYDYEFKIDSNKHLLQTSKSGLGYNVSVNYGNFKQMSESVVIPHNIDLEFNLTGHTSKIGIVLDDVSIEKGNWPNRTSVSTRYKRYKIKEILDPFL